MASLESFRNELAARFAALTLRERGYVAAALGALVFGVWDYGFHAPMTQEQARLRRLLSDAQTRVAELTQQTQAVVARGEVDPDAGVKLQLAQLQQKMDDLQRRREQLAASFMSPYEIAELLRSILKGRGELRLIGLATQAARPLLEAPPESERSTDPAAPMIYRHDLVVELEGSYFAVLDYLRALENQPLFWEAAELTVSTYPKAQVKLQVYTLSFQKEWLGV